MRGAGCFRTVGAGLTSRASTPLVEARTTRYAALVRVP